jgi:hypothetical protein
MKNQKTDYLAARLGIVSNTSTVPYGWEISEEELETETRATTHSFSSFGLVSVSLLVTVLGFGFLNHVLSLN